MKQRTTPFFTIISVAFVFAFVGSVNATEKKNVTFETSRIYCEKHLSNESSIDRLKELENSLRSDAAQKTADQLKTIRTALENGHEVEIGLDQYSNKSKHRGKIERIEVSEWRDMRPREDVRVTVSGRTFSLAINPPFTVTTIETEIRGSANDSKLEK